MKNDLVDNKRRELTSTELCQLYNLNRLCNIIINLLLSMYSDS